jgi:hypothetical protein
MKITTLELSCLVDSGYLLIGVLLYSHTKHVVNRWFLDFTKAICFS